MISHSPASDTGDSSRNEKALEDGLANPRLPSSDVESKILFPDGVLDKESLSKSKSKQSRHSQSQSRPRSASLQYSRSIADGQGCECCDKKAENSEGSSENYGAPDRAFEVMFDQPDDPMNPRRKRKLYKWAVVLIVCSSATCVTCTSSLYTLTYDQLTEEFQVSRVVATLGLSLFVMGLGVGPMFLAPLSEFFGRRPIYIVSFSLFVIWIIPCAVAQNIGTMLISRFLDGLAGAAFLSVAGGTVGDLFARHELHTPMMVYTASPFIGPAVGPLIGGFINQYASWRWSFYTLLIWAGIMLLCLLAVPETYHPVVLKHKAYKLRNTTGDSRWYAPIEKSERSIVQTIIRSCYRPFLLLALEPMVLNLCLFSSIILGILYLFFGAFILVFHNNHGFTTSQVGMSFLGLLVGMLAGILTDPLWHKNYVYLVQKREDEGGEPGGSEPEFRLPPAILGAILEPIALFWFGWTTYSSVHWIVPIIASGLFGTGMLFVFTGIFTFLVDSYPLYAASALAANSFARSSFAAAFPLFGVQMYEKLGYQWATSLLGFLALAMAPFPYIFFKYGKRIRRRSKFASAR